MSGRVMFSRAAITPNRLYCPSRKSTRERSPRSISPRYHNFCLAQEGDREAVMLRTARGDGGRQGGDNIDLNAAEIFSDARAEHSRLP